VNTLKSQKPYGFKAIAILGVFINSIDLIFFSPLAIYNLVTGNGIINNLDLWLGALTMFIWVPLVCLLLISSIGLLMKQTWSRKLCLICLLISIFIGTISFIIESILLILNWSDKVKFGLLALPFCIAFISVEIFVVFYLKQKSVKNYLTTFSN